MKPLHCAKQRLPVICAALVLALWLVPAGAALAGDQVADSDFFKAYPDEKIRTLIEDAGCTKMNGGAAQVRVFDRTDVDVEHSGLSHIRNHTLTKVLTERGGLGLSALRFDYDPATNFIDILEVRIFRSCGKIEDVDVTAYADAVQPAHGIYWGMRMKVLPIPRLYAGDAVELKTYKKGFLIAYLEGPSDDDDERYIPPMRTHYYDMILFEEGIPVKDKTYAVHTVRERPLMFDVFNGECTVKTSFDENKFHYVWSKKDIPAVKGEPRAPNNWDYATKVVMATVQTWEEKSRWFDDANKAQFDSNDAIQAMVDEVVKDCKNDDEKSTALNRWVANNIRYSGLSMGKGEGYTLHPGWMIFEERAGVCKDIAGMLITMMRAADIPAYPAMTMAGARVEYIPADQFNHCVVARQMPDGTFRMYDPTWCPMSMTDWSLAEAEQHYVVGTPEGETLDAIQYYTPEESLIRIESRGTLLADGTLEGRLQFEGRGYNDTYLRRILATYNRKRDVKSALEGWLLRVSPRAEITGWKSGDIRDLTRPVTIDVEYRIPGYGLAYGGEKGDTIEVMSPAVQVLLNQLVRAESATRSSSRTLPLFLYLAARHDVDETIAVPDGYKIGHAAAARSIDNEAADLTTSVTEDGGSLRIAFSLAIKNRNTPPELYGKVYEVMKNARAFRDETVTLSRTGSAQLTSAK